MENLTIKLCSKYHECYSILKGGENCDETFADCTWFRTKQQRLEMELSKFSKDK
jgi:hypothetical protein